MTITDDMIRAAIKAGDLTILIRAFLVKALANAETLLCENTFPQLTLWWILHSMRPVC